MDDIFFKLKDLKKFKLQYKLDWIFLLKTVILLICFNVIVYLIIRDWRCCLLTRKIIIKLFALSPLKVIVRKFKYLAYNFPEIIYSI